MSNHNNSSTMSDRIGGPNEGHLQFRPRYEAGRDGRKWSQRDPLLKEHPRTYPSNNDWPTQILPPGRQREEDGYMITRKQHEQRPPGRKTHNDRYGESREMYPGGNGGGDIYATDSYNRPMPTEPGKFRAGQAPRISWDENFRLQEDRGEMRSWTDEERNSGPTPHVLHVRGGDSSGSGQKRREEWGIRHDAEGCYWGRGSDYTSRGIRDTRIPQRGVEKTCQERENDEYYRYNSQWQQPPTMHHGQEYGHSGTIGAPRGISPRMMPAAPVQVSTRASMMHNPVDSEELERIKAKKDAYRKDLEAQVSTRVREAWGRTDRETERRGRGGGRARERPEGLCQIFEWTAIG